jgi:hypothetical protein
MQPLSCKPSLPYHPCRPYSNQYRRQEGFGDGPMRSCYVLAARRLLDEQTDKKIWLERHGWLVPNLSPSDEGPHSPERLDEFRVAGAFAALYFLIMRQPMPRISPHITLLLLCGSCPPEYSFLKSVDPRAASVLAPWFEFVREGSVNQAFTGAYRPGDIHHLLAEYLDEQVCISFVTLCGFYPSSCNLHLDWHLLWGCHHALTGYYCSLEYVSFWTPIPCSTWGVAGLSSGLQPEWRCSPGNALCSSQLLSGALICHSPWTPLRPSALYACSTSVGSVSLSKSSISSSINPPGGSPGSLTCTSPCWLSSDFIQRDICAVEDILRPAQK